MEELNAALRRRDLEGWQQKRLSVIRLVSMRKLKAVEIAKASGVSRDSVFDFIGILLKGGVKRLLERHYHGGNRPARMDGATQSAFVEQVGKGSFRRAKDAQKWMKGHGVKLAHSSCYYWLKKSMRGAKNAPECAFEKGRGQGGGVQGRAGKKVG